MQKILIVSDLFPPYQYYLADGTPGGIDYELVSSLLTEAGYSVDVLLDDWDKVNNMMAAKEADALFQVVPTPERLKRYFFSQKYRDAYTDIITKKEELYASDYQKFALSGIKLGKVDGYTYGENVNSLPQFQKVNYKDIKEELLAVDSGMVPAGVFDRGAYEVLCKELKISGLHRIEPLTYSRPMFVMFNDKEICRDFNEALKRRENT